MSQKLKPLGDRIIVELIEAEDKTAGGIILPETAKEKPQEGKVLAVGAGRWDEEGKKRVPLDVKVGDRVIFAKYSGTDWKVREGDKDVKYLILGERDVLAVVE